MKNVKYDGKFLKVRLKPHNDTNYEIVEMNDAVAVIATNQHDQVLLVKQFRPVCGKYTYEIPAGMLDVNGESPSETACRELLEETNLIVHPDNLSYLVSYFPIVGSVNHKITIYKTSINNDEFKNIENDDVIERVWMSKEDLDNLIAQGYIIDGKTLLAYNMIKSH